jgi:adenylate kinase family enzyme
VKTFPYRRICIIGPSASGKTTLSKTIAQRTGIDHIEIDAIYHGPNWAQPPDFTERVYDALERERWIADGNYMNYVSILGKADLIIWLDYPFRIVLWRVLRRTAYRLVSRKPLWNGNRETLRLTFSKESIILWVFQTYWKRKEMFPRLLASHEGIEQLIFRHPRHTRKWLNNMIKAEAQPFEAARSL